MHGSAGCWLDDAGCWQASFMYACNASQQLGLAMTDSFAMITEHQYHGKLHHVVSRRPHSVLRPSMSDSRLSICGKPAGNRQQCVGCSLSKLTLQLWLQLHAFPHNH